MATASGTAEHAFRVIAKPIGPVCNLSCEYCYYLEKHTLYGPNNQWAMQPEVLELFIRQYPATRLLWRAAVSQYGTAQARR